MAKIKKLNSYSYSEEKNNQPDVEIIDEELPETKQMVKIEKMDMPLTTVEEAKAMWQQYQDLMNALMKESDIVEIQGRKIVKKSGVNKIARFFGYSVEILRTKRVEYSGPQGGKSFVWYSWVKAIAPNGRYRTDGAACSSAERRFAHPAHDILAQSLTRASSRAIQELAGVGELSLADEEDASSGNQTPPEANQSDNNSNFMGTGDPDTWKPLFKVNKFSKFVPSNDKMEISEKAREWVKAAIKRAGAELGEQDEVLFILNNRADGQPRSKTIEQLNKGDFYDISETIKRKGKEGLIKLIEIIRKEIPNFDALPKEPESDGSIMEKKDI